MWGLIDEKYCKVDFWVNCLKKIAKKTNPNEQISQELLNNFQKDLDDNRLSFDPSSEPIKVKSAYGGFGIYKIDKVYRNGIIYDNQKLINTAKGMEEIQSRP